MPAGPRAHPEKERAHPLPARARARSGTPLRLSLGLGEPRQEKRRRVCGIRPGQGMAGAATLRAWWAAEMKPGSQNRARNLVRARPGGGMGVDGWGVDGRKEEVMRQLFEDGRTYNRFT